MACVPKKAVIGQALVDFLAPTQFWKCQNYTDILDEVIEANMISEDDV